MMKRNLYVLLSLLVLASVVLSACGGGNTPPAQAVAPVAEPVLNKWTDTLFTFQAQTPQGCGDPAACKGVLLTVSVPDFMKDVSVTINWGDNTPEEPFSQATHAYAAPGSYMVTVKTSKTVSGESGMQNIVELKSSFAMQIPLQAFKPAEAAK